MSQEETAPGTLSEAWALKNMNAFHAFNLSDSNWHISTRLLKVAGLTYQQTELILHSKTEHTGGTERMKRL